MKCLVENTMLLFNTLFVVCLSQDSINERFDCYPEPSPSQSNCESRGCIWNACPDGSPPNCPSCYYPSDWGYTFDSSNDLPNGIQYNINQGKYKNPYGSDITNVQANIYYETNNRLHIKFMDKNDPNRYQVPIKLPQIPNTKASNPVYSVIKSINNGSIFGLNVTQNGEQILTTSLPGFAYSDQFLQIMIGYNDKHITSYGFGERYANIMLPYNVTHDTWGAWPMFARDIADGDNSYRNSYGVHPFVLNILDNGMANGIFFVNSNAMEAVITPYPGVQFRTIGGIIDIYMVFGDTPNDVIKEYWNIVGYPYIPPLWGLGFHLCRYGYNTINRTRQVVQNMRKNMIPQDTQWNDIDYMHTYEDFTYNQQAYAGLPEFVSNELHDQYNMKYIMIVDPGIQNLDGYEPYESGLQQDVFIKDATGNVLIGRCWPGTIGYPDFLAPQTKQWWAEQAIDWQNTVNFDGYWIDMNEPSNFVTGSVNGCPNNKYENPPYFPSSLDENPLSQKTICMTATQYYIGPGNNNNKTIHYNTHSLYGFSDTVATSYALNQTFNNKRNVIISRSSYPTHGQYGGHW